MHVVPRIMRQPEAFLDPQNAPKSPPYTYVYLLLTLFILGMLYAITHWAELMPLASPGQPILARSTGSDRPIGHR